MSLRSKKGYGDSHKLNTHINVRFYDNVLFPNVDSGWNPNILTQLMMNEGKKKKTKKKIQMQYPMTRNQVVKLQQRRLRIQN